jgi:hypothetical protein
LEFSFARTPFDLFLQPGLTLFIWLRFNFVSLLDPSCINLMFPCTKRSLTRSKEVYLSCTFLSCSASLREILPDWVTPCLISFLDAYLDSYPRLYLIPYSSRYPKRNLSRYLSVLPRALTKPYPSMLPKAFPESLPDCLTRPGNSFPVLSKVFYLSW